MANPRGFTFYDYVSRAKAVHNNYYDYLPDGYTTGCGKVTLVCPKHGISVTTAQEHLKGHLCKFCGQEKALTTKRNNWKKHYDIIVALHPTYDFPDYGANFTTVTDKCKVICPEHGEFYISTHKLKRGQGCATCAKTYREKRWSSENVMEQFAKFRETSTYIYYPETFTGYCEKMKFGCKTHGDFWQTVEHHALGFGCKKCSSLSNAQVSKKSNEELLDRCRKVHGSKYNYPEELSGVTGLWKIDCPIHGRFEQLGYVHLRGSHCPVCAGIGSDGQRMLAKIVTSVFSSAITDYRFSTENRQQLDVYVPHVNVAFEFDGIYWHSSKFKSKTWHKDKLDLCQTSGITLYQTYSNLAHSPAFERFVLSKVGVFDLLAVGEQELISLDSAEASAFHNEYNLLGAPASLDFSFGTYTDGVLTSAVSFSKVIGKGYAESGKMFKLERVSRTSDSHKEVQDLLKYAVSCLAADWVVAVTDNRLSKGTTLASFGFRVTTQHAPRAVGVVTPNNANLERVPDFRGKKLQEWLGECYNPKKSDTANLEENKFYYVFDSGSTYWIWKRNNVNS